MSIKPNQAGTEKDGSRCMAAREIASYLAIAFALLVVPTAASAIGDSGGCGDPLGGPLGKAVTTGSPQAVEDAIRALVDSKEARLTRTERVALFLGGGRSAVEKWRAQMFENYVAGIHESGVCAPGPLLSVAVQAGNLDVGRYLLDTRMGATAGVPPYILFRCEYGLALTDQQRLQRREAYALVLDSKKIDINYVSGGETALQACKEPELTKLFIERGARVDVTVTNSRTGLTLNLAESAVLDAVKFEEGSYPSKRLHGIERARIFAQLGMDSIEGRPVEKQVRYLCNLTIRQTKWNAKTCQALSAFIKASPGTFGQP